MSDHQSLMDLMNAGTPIPAGEYFLAQPIRVQQTGKTLDLSAGVILRFDETQPYWAGQNLIQIEADEFTLIGGELRGLWQMELQGTEDVRLVKTLYVANTGIRCVSSSARKVTIKETLFRRFSGKGIYCDVTRLSGTFELSIHDAIFDQNFHHLEMVNYSGDKKLPTKIRLSNIRFKETAKPFTKDATQFNPETGQPYIWEGGNAFSTVNGLLDVRVVNCKFTDCGRMCIELYRSEDLGHYTSKLEVFNSVFDRPHYRNVSTGVCDVTLKNNWFHTGDSDPGWMELSGPGFMVLEDNTFIGLGPFWPLHQGHHIVRNNRFLSTEETGSDQFQGSLFWKIHQTIDPEYIMGGTGRFSVLVEDNEFTYTHEKNGGYAIHRYDDGQSRTTTLGGEFDVTRNTYSSIGTKVQFQITGTNFLSVLPVTKDQTKILHKTHLSRNASSAGYNVTVTYNDDGTYSIELDSSFPAGTNLSWKERDSSSMEPRFWTGKVKNLYYTGLNTRQLSNITPEYQNYELHDFQIHNVTLS